jgi:hypothetical protein
MSNSNNSQRYSHPHSCTLMDFIYNTNSAISAILRARVLLKATVNFYDCLASVTNERMGTEHWWNDSNMEKATYPRKSLPQCHFAHHEYHMEWPGVEPTGFPQ